MKTSQTTVVSLTALLLMTCLHPALSAASTPPNWPQFRGPGGNAVAEGQTIPLEFGPSHNLLWKTSLATGHSSPCIWGDRIFVTGHVDTSLKMICVRRSDGKILWERERSVTELPRYMHSAGSPANPTPATDGRLVIFSFDDYGVIATDFAGETLWEKRLPATSSAFGAGASPVVEGGRLYLSRDGGLDPSLLCLDVATGEQIWRVDRPNAVMSFSTPYLWSNGNQKQVLLGGSGTLNAYDAASGAPVWHVTGLAGLLCPSPAAIGDMIVAGGFAMPHATGRSRVEGAFESDAGVPEKALEDPQVFFDIYDTNKDGRLAVSEIPPGRAHEALPFMDGNQSGFVEMEEWAPFYSEQQMMPGRNVMVGIRPNGTGDLTDTNVKWEATKSLPYVASPLVYRGRVYFVKAGGFMSCLDARTGKVHYQGERLGVAGEYFATPVGVGDHIVVCAMRGKVLTVTAGDKLEIAAQNDLGEALSATPAVVDNTLYIRSDRHLWAFGE